MDNMEYAEEIQDAFDSGAADPVKLKRRLKEDQRRRHGITYPREESFESQPTGRPHHTEQSERIIVQRGHEG